MVDFFSFDGEATDKPKPASEIRRFQRPGDVPGDEPKQHHVAGTFNLGGLLAPDQMTPFEKLNRRMVYAENVRERRGSGAWLVTLSCGAGARRRAVRRRTAAP